MKLLYAGVFFSDAPICSYHYDMKSMIKKQWWGPYITLFPHYYVKGISV